MAGRGTDIKLGEGVEALGGLAVIIHEHMENSRVDRQLHPPNASTPSPSLISVPRPAILVATVMEPICPASAIMLNFMKRGDRFYS
jgi:hypothetical protein